MTGGGSKLIIVCGLPGSGKTTHAKSLECRFSAVRMCPDEWMEALSTNIYNEQSRYKIEALQWQLARRLLALGLTVIVEWGTWSRSERDALRVEARAIGASVELHYLAAPLEVLYDRIKQRGTEHPPIQRDALAQWFQLFQVPTPEEFALFDKPSIGEGSIALSSGVDQK